MTIYTASSADQSAVSILWNIFKTRDENIHYHGSANAEYKVCIWYENRRYEGTALLKLGFGTVTLLEVQKTTCNGTEVFNDERCPPKPISSFKRVNIFYLSVIYIYIYIFMYVCLCVFFIQILLVFFVLILLSRHKMLIFSAWKLWTICSPHLCNRHKFYLEYEVCRLMYIITMQSHIITFSSCCSDSRCGLTKCDNASPFRPDHENNCRGISPANKGIAEWKGH